MSRSDTALRSQLAAFLDWRSAHADFDAAVKGLPARLRGKVPPGFVHSVWDQVEHLRLAQADILEFCRSSAYREKRWPDDYWPAQHAPRRADAWARSLAAFRRDRNAMQRLARNSRVDLFATIPHGTGQTYLREILLVADHNAYHVAQIIDVRRALGAWD
jgi:uncharacterized damage-inducible protein DinB